MTGDECSDALLNPKLDAWSFCRRLIRMGIDIESTCETKGRGYEEQSSMVDDAARKAAAELEAAMKR